jgi:hypothetical protein
MDELTKLEQLQEAVAALPRVVDIATAKDYATAYHLYNDVYEAWSRARLDLNNYLKEKDK